MELKDVFTLIIALYGAAIATILGIREIRKEKREVDLYFEIIEKAREVREARIVIVNTGHRPITMSNLGLRLYFSNKPRKVLWGNKPQRAVVYRFEEVDAHLPVTLKDGEQEIIEIADFKFEDIWQASDYAVIQAYDAEGKLYKSNKVRLFNDPAGIYEAKN